MPKVIFLNNEKLNERVRRDFYFDYLTQRNIKYEYWDLSKLFNIKGKQINSDNCIRIFKNYAELEEAVKKVNDGKVLFLTIINYDFRAYKLYRCFTRNKVYLGFFKRGLFPSPNLSFIASIKRKFNSIIYFKDYLRNRLAILIFELGYIKEYDVVFTAGNVAESMYRNSKTIPLNLFDFDCVNAIKQGNSERIFEFKFCVFLDDNAALHPDLDLLNIKRINREAYFSLMNNFFDSIEKKHGLKVIIAAHPSSNYSEKTFNGRAFIKYKTGELVKDAEFAIAIASTSISYPILFKKPILFFYTQDIIRNYAKLNYGQYAVRLSELLSCTLFDIGNVENVYNVNEVDNDKYNDFVGKYLATEDSGNKKSQEIFTNFLING
jgi:hypothetical protein